MSLIPSKNAPPLDAPAQVWIDWLVSRGWSRAEAEVVVRRGAA